MKTIFTLLEEMIPSVRERRWDELETRYKDVATKLAGAAKAAAIAAVDLDEFHADLSRGLKKAVARAKRAGAKAVYFEYDLDNRWGSNFFICPDYNPESEGDEDWACDFDDDLPGPDQREFARIYEENPGFDRPPATMGTTLYMVARTVASFGRAMDGLTDEDIAICMAFHDQDPIVRMRERGARPARRPRKRGK